jgi:GT2 family glycosyltransferase
VLVSLLDGLCPCRRAPRYHMVYFSERLPLYHGAGLLSEGDGAIVLIVGEDKITVRCSDSTLDASIIIVNWNSTGDLECCLQSIFRWVDSATTFETVVVDNASTYDLLDGAINRFPQVRFIRNGSNVGFSAANNSGIACATGRYVLLLNPDTVFTEDCISPMIAKMDKDSSIGMMGCRLVNGDGSHQKSVDLFPFPFQEINPAFRRYRHALLAKVQSAIETSSAVTVGVLLGAFQMIPRRLLCEVGMLDSSLFMYGEDLDLCYRIERAGKKVVFDPSVSIIHLGGKSSEKVWDDGARLVKVRQSIFLVQCKHFGAACAVGGLCVRTVLGWLRCLALVAKPRDRAGRRAYFIEAMANHKTLMNVPTLLARRKSA